MATTYKILEQVAPSANSDTTLYTVPSATSTVVSTIAICNRGVSSTFRIAVRPTADALANKHYIVFDNVVAANDTVFLTLGITLQAAVLIVVHAGTADFSFSAFGSELT